MTAAGEPDRAAIYELLQTVTRPAILEVCRPTSCMISARTVLEALEAFGIRDAKAVQVQAVVSNATASVALAQERTPDRERGDWLVGLGFTPNGEQGIHVVVVTADALIDIAADQASRPEQGMALGPLVVSLAPGQADELRRGGEVGFRRPDGVAIHYVGLPGARDYTRSPNWGHSYASIRAGFVRRTVLAGRVREARLERRDVAEALATVARPALRTVFRAHSCIASTRVALDVLAAAGFAAYPLTVEAQIGNAAARADREGAFGRIRGSLDPRHDPDAMIHLVALSGDLLIDLALDQADDPEHDLACLPLVAQLSKGELEALLAGEPLGIELPEGGLVVYRAAPADRTFETTRVWGREASEARAVIIDETLRALARRAAAGR